ncbi:hypothetical protein RND71_018512 [Anisodus tanguticus]|uniref:Uncharacterized protein n=1 Tax=Anisodus tanguticus TaxID=243964 RepID=A0AAE1S4E4_9SOLA|nr:hypothetical protein RND71_018512 [Anisodus tanguticus]
MGQQHQHVYLRYYPWADECPHEFVEVFTQACGPLLYGNALQSDVLRLRKEIFLVDAGLGTPIICMQDEPIGVPINRATKFEKKVGFLDLVVGESMIKVHILERFFIDVVASESLIKERAAARFNDLVGSTDVVAGEPLLLLP